MFNEFSANYFHEFFTIILGFILVLKSDADSSEATTNAPDSTTGGTSTGHTVDESGLWILGLSLPQMGAIVGATVTVGCVALVIYVAVSYVKRLRSGNRVLGSSRSTKNQQRKRGAERGSQASEEEQEGHSYPEMSTIWLQGASDSRTYLELVAEDGDNGAGKGLKQVYAKQEDFRKDMKPIEVQKESNLDYVNSGICKEESKIVYEKLDQFGNNLNPVYDQLNLSSMMKNPVEIKK